jgi:sulfur-oxidizing protein SoxY
MKRRRFIALAAGGVAAASLPVRAQEVQDIRPLVDAITKGAVPEEGGIEIALPPIAENGHSVPFTVRVPSPMSEADHVREIHVLAERNPRPAVATFHLGPWSGRAEVSTRVRLAGTQKVTVVAALSGGRYRIARKEVVVESAACLDEGSLS